MMPCCKFPAFALPRRKDRPLWDPTGQKLWGQATVFSGSGPADRSTTIILFLNIVCTDVVVVQLLIAALQKNKKTPQTSGAVASILINT